MSEPVALAGEMVAKPVEVVGVPQQRGAMATTGETTDDSDGGEALTMFIDGELTIERDRRTQLVQRGAGIITTSAGLATLLFAAAALVTGMDTFQPPRLTLLALAMTFVGFAGAALCGLMASRQRTSRVVDYQQLEKWRQGDRYWCNSKANMNRMLARAKILSLMSLRAANNSNAVWARSGFITQLVSLGALVIAVGAILAAAIWPNLVGSWGF
jgi:hypothetical protein